MSTERVDKSWQTKGLKAYSNEAIVGTLGHYGVAIDEAGFKELSSKEFPLKIAEGWHEKWKGKGQFAVFPLAAADELWTRLQPGKLHPQKMAEALAKLIIGLEKGTDSDAAFKDVDALKGQLPKVDDKVPEPFVAEVAYHLGQGLDAFNKLAEKLALAGKASEGQRVAELEELLFPHRAGVSTALVRAAKGEKDAAVQALDALAGKDGAEPQAKLEAFSGLLRLNAHPEALKRGVGLIDWAEKEDLHLALGITEQLHKIAERLEAKDSPVRADLVARHKRLSALHDELHPHHRAHSH
jgi:hypothetical protein